MSITLNTQPANDEAETPNLPGMEPANITRQEVLRVMNEEGKTQPWAAKQAEIAYTTFNAWMNGKYAGDNDAVHDKVRNWLAARKTHARTRAVMPKAPGFVVTQTAEAITVVLEHAQHAPDLVVVTGAPGVGKTITCSAYRASSSSVWMITAEPCYSTPRMLLDRLIEEIGSTEKYSSQKVSGAIVRRVRGSGGLIIVDEAQHLSSAALDQLRTIHDMAEIGVALVGNDTVYTRLEGGSRTAEFAQLFSRVGMRLKRRHALQADIDMLLDVWGIQGAPQRALLRQIARSNGALRGMTKTIRLAATRAAMDGRDGMTKEDIEAAFEQINSTTISKVKAA